MTEYGLVRLKYYLKPYPKPLSTLIRAQREYRHIVHNINCGSLEFRNLIKFNSCFVLSIVLFVLFVLFANKINKSIAKHPLPFSLPLFFSFSSFHCCMFVYIQKGSVNYYLLKYLKSHA